MNVSNLDLSSDIYYQDEYISLYLREGESIFDFSYKEGDDFFINKSIKRPIKTIGNIHVNEGFYDLESAYGYGGYYTKSNSYDFICRAMTAYKQKCKDENIISEFIRFHPFNDFPVKNASWLDFNIYDRDVVVVDLKQDIWSTYKAKVRNIVKKSTNKVIIEESEDIKLFEQLYRMTMKKNGADEFYFFNSDMFRKLLEIKGTKLYAVKYMGSAVAMGFFLEGSQINHYHLSANSPESYKLNSNYALLNYAFEQAITSGNMFVMLGGGISGDSDDSLFKFKRKFSEQTLPFYISGNIFNRKKYTEYVNLWNEQSSVDVRYFLKYRLNVH